MKKNATKRALVLSIVSLMLCFSMLLGTTYAWFTDSVTSTNNIIKSGNLDVKLQYSVLQEDGTWTEFEDVDEDTNVFKEGALWEPGYTEVVRLKVENAGSLALKYQLGVNIVDEKGSVNVDNETFKLSDHIMYGIVEGNADYSRETAIAAVAGSATKLKSAYSSEITSLPAANATDSDEDYVTMVVYMPTTVGNEANAKTGAAVPTIYLGINLFATQEMAEEDSFNNEYDKEAKLPEIGFAQIPANTTEDTRIQPTADDASVIVTVPAGAPEGLYKLNVENLAVTEDASGNSTAHFEIELLKDGVAAPAGTYTVEINVGKNLNIQGITHNGEAVTGYSYDSASGVVTFTTSSFSPFTVTYYSGVIAEGATTEEIIAQIAKGGSFVLNTDVSLKEGEKILIPEGEKVTLDLNGKTLTGDFQTGSSTKHVYTIENRGELVLAGEGTVSGRGVANYGKLTINGGVYNALDTNGGGSVWMYAGTLTVNGGKFVTAEASVAPAATCINVAAGAEAIINGGEFISNANQTAAIINNGKLTINNAKIVSDHNVFANTGEMIINGGEFELVGVANQTSNMVYASAGKTTINGGSFIYDKNDVLDSGHLLTFAGGEIVVTGGNFEGYVTTQLDNYGYTSGKATVTGGTFDQNPEKWVAEGYTVEDLGGKFAVTKVVGPTVNLVVKSAAELQAALSPSVSDGKAVVSLEADIELGEGETWSPLPIDPYVAGSVNQVVINGNGHTIKGLNAPLFGDVHFGGTTVIIKDLTLTDCKIENQVYNSGLGAFIAYADSCDLITFSNCHLKDSTVASVSGTGVGGLIGYSSSTLMISDCSVTNCTITGASQSAGAIAGHVSAGSTNITTIENAQVVGCTVKGERVDKSGYVLGTANVGATTITTKDCSDNTVFDTANSETVYGRLVGGTLTVNGVAK